MSDELAADRWRLVRGADIPRHVRHLLLILQHYQRSNETAWCTRIALSEELDVCDAVVSQSMKTLESLGVVRRVWTSRNGRPSREYAIQYSELAKRQRSVRESSGCESSSVRESSGSVLGNPHTQCEGILTHKEAMKNHRINQERVARSKPKSKKFRKPTSAMVQEYATSLEQPAFDAGKFVDYYESNGWRVGGKGSMKCWKAAVRNWIRTGGTQSKGGKPTVGADSDQAWQSLKQILRKIDKTKPYRELIRKQLKPEVYRAAETVGFSQLFSIDQFNESKLLAAFSTALGEKIR